MLITRRVALARGERLFRQGDAFDGVYIVASGCMKLRETSADGGERIVALCTPGEIVGLEGWAYGRHPHAALAATDATLCRLSMPARGGAVSVDLLERVLAKAAMQLERASRPWAGRPALERVAAFVEDLAERLGDPRLAHGATPLPMTRAEIGSYLGLAEETVVRALAKLARPERAAGAARERRDAAA
ncbi:MAG TPA: Crp/Fnr family transcriptional regulator [Gammaproteobacteria bacterium]